MNNISVAVKRGISLVNRDCRDYHRPRITVLPTIPLESILSRHCRLFRILSDAFVTPGLFAVLTAGRRESIITTLRERGTPDFADISRTISLLLLQMIREKESGKAGLFNLDTPLIE